LTVIGNRCPTAGGWKRGVLVCAGLVVALANVSCGGGSSGSGTPVVELAASSRQSPWTSGTLEFSISPALKTGETMQCSLDGGPSVECGISPAAGRLPYDELAHGDHRLTVTVGDAASRRNASANWRVMTPDVVVLGATPAGLMAGIAASRAGRQVVVLEPSRWVGGVIAGGLAKTDIHTGMGIPLGWITQEFFDKARALSVANGNCAAPEDCPFYYDVEPRMAKTAFEQMVAAEPNLWLGLSQRVLSAEKEGARITAVTTGSGRISGSIFIDASYEGDLMAMTGVSHTTAREPRLEVDPGHPQYGEREDDAGTGAFKPPYGLFIDPYKVPGDPKSGTIAFVEPQVANPPAPGSGDDRLMAYNYRLCVTDDPTNKVPFTRPADYDAERYEGAARLAMAMAASGRMPLDRLYFNPSPTVRSKNGVHFKHDLNGGSVFSTDMSTPGWNQAYPAASPEERAAIEAAYRSYMQGLIYTWQTDPRFGALNAKVARFGLCKDEFVDNGHWSYRLYTRETRRMLGEYVMNQNDLFQNGRRPAVTDSVALGGYNIDSHVRRITVAPRSISGAPPREMVVFEGFLVVHIPDERMYPISYRSLVPRRTEVTNLLNPVTLSMTSVGYASARMEPTFMMLGQAAGVAANLALETGDAVQDVDLRELQRRFASAGHVYK
jgi:hypothetical protein